MPAETAVWKPYWQELDQSIAVGQAAYFDFFKSPPDHVESDGRAVFYHGDWNERCRHLFEKQFRKILAIKHPTLGDIRSIDANGFDYTFKMADGRVLKVDADRTPGSIRNHPDPIDDWRIEVELEIAGSPV
jgi:hypothetical protein